LILIKGEKPEKVRLIDDHADCSIKIHVSVSAVGGNPHFFAAHIVESFVPYSLTEPVPVIYDLPSAGHPHPHIPVNPLSTAIVRTMGIRVGIAAAITPVSIVGTTVIPAVCAPGDIRP